MKLGFIGSGNMASAMIAGIIKSGSLQEKEIIVSDMSAQALEKTGASLGVATTKDNKKVAEQCEVLVLSVKPQYYQSVIAEIAPAVADNTLVVTIAPGQTLERLEGYFGRPVKLVRTMPNTPALVGEGMTAACRNGLVSDSEFDYVISLLEGFGRCEVVPERLMDTVVGVSGSSPAYVFMLIEAMADAAVLEGMARPMAYEFAAQAVLGSAKMVLETGLHPGQLKDMVCSPGGTTIQAVAALEQGGFRSSIIQAIHACVKKSKSM